MVSIGIKTAQQEIYVQAAEPVSPGTNALWIW